MKEKFPHWVFVIFFIFLVLILIPISIIYLSYIHSGNGSILGNIIATVLYSLYVISIFVLYQKTMIKKPSFEKSLEDIKNPYDPSIDYKTLRKSYAVRLLTYIVIFLSFEFLVLIIFVLVKSLFT